MPAIIRAVGTAVPPTTLDQRAVQGLFAAQPALSRLGQRIVGAAFGASAVDQRHTVLSELLHEGASDFVDEHGVIRSPSTRFRNDRYRETALPLFVAAAADALSKADIAADQVTHVVTVSCTGFTQPGPDLAVATELGMRPGVFRHHIGFMGCYAAFPALRTAAAFCAEDPDAVVLVVCAELCTLHIRASDDPDQIVANSVFGDGAAAAVVTPDLPDARFTAEPDPDAPLALRLDAFASSVIPEGAGDMAWNIGDEGFEMVLSSAVPHLIEQHVAEAVAPVLAAIECDDATSVPLWAVHPGGRAILDRVEDELQLPAMAIDASRRVLAEHGNMSSGTVLFVLDRILQDGAEPGSRVVALAFGPGLTVETAALEVVRA
ncbi:MULTISPECIES: type III polyketide synthase [unclassified Curtobacterium]|uniref:type III polyketide synthase n=1 Tax=unclassified Curtobacterium TaxID=257496 RepID=UPI000DA988FB|nr:MULTISPECIES: type III polyketide synthase [unclassified Curtobacterium]PZE25298.1 type III polyketide synthase [Curtobacterium sp. MCBD17_028]PZE71218.1 type III polyketide synthase [Curtobacterium sp. MCBD17_019]PZF57901.1 type III polyketide synthase [Curtobacterium sp. MCBD17_013]PZF57934.1 type III polyketide synthase [Curtobacterium sp. MCBD17_034]PZM33413.1 type III polyketide synthase [Curtobacterium sp. MCBD17_031]